MKNFAMTGVAGFVAPRHLAAIKATGNRLVAAVDPHDAVGVLDRYALDVRFFTDIEGFDRHIDTRRRGPEADRVHIVTVCSPNYLHDAHIRLALRAGADVICEKPLVLDPRDLDALEAIEKDTGRRVYTVLQLRLHPQLMALKARLDAEGAAIRREVELTYVTARGAWYDVSWKGSDERGGGIATNIGIHLLDLLLWLFGSVQESIVHLHGPRRMAGALEMERARVRWFLSTEMADLPQPLSGGRATHRSIVVDGSEVEFSDGFSDLHTRVYEETLAGRGFGIADARPSITLSSQIRMAPATSERGRQHPKVKG